MQTCQQRSAGHMRKNRTHPAHRWGRPASTARVSRALDMVRRSICCVPQRAFAGPVGVRRVLCYPGGPAGARHAVSPAGAPDMLCPRPALLLCPRPALPRVFRHAVSRVGGARCCGARDALSPAGGVPSGRSVRGLDMLCPQPVPASTGVPSQYRTPASTQPVSPASARAMSPARASKGLEMSPVGGPAGATCWVTGQ